MMSAQAIGPQLSIMCRSSLRHRLRFTGQSPWLTVPKFHLRSASLPEMAAIVWNIRVQKKGFNFSKKAIFSLFFVFVLWADFVRRAQFYKQIFFAWYTWFEHSYS